MFAPCRPIDDRLPSRETMANADAARDRHYLTGARPSRVVDRPRRGRFFCPSVRADRVAHERIRRERNETTVASYTIAVVGGDGIGPEVVREAVKVLDATGVQVTPVPFELGAAHYLRTGEVLPDAVLAELAQTDAILFGAVGPPIGSNEIPSGLLESGLLLKLRFELDL